MLERKGSQKNIGKKEVGGHQSSTSSCSKNQLSKKLTMFPFFPLRHKGRQRFLSHLRIIGIWGREGEKRLEGHIWLRPITTQPLLTQKISQPCSGPAAVSPSNRADAADLGFSVRHCCKFSTRKCLWKAKKQRADT